MGQICLFEAQDVYFPLKQVWYKNLLWCKKYGQKIINSSALSIS